MNMMKIYVKYTLMIFATLHDFILWQLKWIFEYVCEIIMLERNQIFVSFIYLNG